MDTKDIDELRAAAIGVTHIVGYQTSIPHGQAQTFARGMVALCDEVERLNGLRRELQAEIERLQDRCAKSGVEARRAEQERIAPLWRFYEASTRLEATLGAINAIEQREAQSEYVAARDKVAGLRHNVRVEAPTTAPQK